MNSIELTVSAQTSGLCCVLSQCAFQLICFHSNFCQSQANSQQAGVLKGTCCSFPAVITSLDILGTYPLYICSTLSFVHPSPHRCCLTRCLLTILAYVIPVCHFSCFHVLINHHHLHHSLHAVILPTSLLHLCPVQLLREDPLT